MSSSTEGLPLALCEAMATSLPVVATAVGGIPGVVTADAGTVVPHDDPAALGAALAALLGDAARRKSQGEAGRRRALELFSVERMCSDYEKVFGG